MWVFLHVLLGKSGTLLLSCFQESFHKGLWYPPLPTPAQKWCCAFVANPPSSPLAASTGVTQHSPTDEHEKHSDVISTSVTVPAVCSLFCQSLSFFISFPVSIRCDLSLFVILSWAFSAALCKCSQGSHGCWWVKKKKDPGNISYGLHKVAGPWVFFFLLQRPTFALHYLSLSLSPSPFALPFLLFHQNFQKKKKWCSVVSSYALGAKVL